VIVVTTQASPASPFARAGPHASSVSQNALPPERSAVTQSPSLLGASLTNGLAQGRLHIHWR
jgi:hypothetical protein